MNLQYNTAAELVAAFFAWTSWERLEKTSRVEQVPWELKQWYENTAQLFPKYFLNQARSLSSEFLLLIFSLLKAVVLQSIRTPDELFRYLSSCGGKEIARLVVLGESFPFSLEELLENPEWGKEALTQSHGTVRPGEEDRLVDFLRYPDYYLDQLRNSLVLFYKKAVKPYEKDVSRKMNSLLAEEKKTAMEDPGNFLETRLFYKKENNETIPETIFLSYYDCLDCMINSEPAIALYGWKNREISPEPDIEEIYSLINDETRRNILKGLSVKAMFSREIAETWNLSPSTVSYHMNRFFMLGLIRHHSGPRKRVYHELNKERLNYFMDCLKKDLLGE